MNEFVVIAIELLILLVVLAGLVFLLFMATLAFFGVPWVRTPSKVGRKMYDVAELKAGEKVADFGCGDASLLITAAKEYGAHGIGYDFNPILISIGRLRARLAGVGDKVELRVANFNTVDLPEVDLIASYLLEPAQDRLAKRFMGHYASGTRVVSRGFKYADLPLIKQEKHGKETVLLYHIP